MPEAPARILIVDDLEQNRYVLRHVLQRAGYACDIARNGREALAKAQDNPDLIILDVNLPDISGYEVCRTIKQDPRTSHIPVLQISASFVSSDAKVRALEGGADGYLVHPIEGLVLIATARSLLRLRAAENTAREAASQWESTFDALSEGVALTDARRLLVRYNRAFVQFCGKDCEVRPGADAEPILERVLGTAVSLEQAAQRIDAVEFTSAQRTILLTVSPITFDGSGGYVVVLTDVTDRRLAEYALRTAEQLAATGRMAHSIAHEINNPLESVINLIYLANHEAGRPQVHAYLEMANKELDRVARITRQSLSFHRDTEHPIEVNVASVVADVVSLYTRIAASKGVTLSYEQVSALAVRGFPGQLTQVFANLIRNAIEASPKGGRVVVRVRPTRDGERAGTRVTVHDTGPGIPADVQARIFDAFFTTKELKGSGLGLWVSRALVSHHGGSIRFRSCNNANARGTTFQVFLPVGGTGLAHSAESVA